MYFVIGFVAVLIFKYVIQGIYVIEQAERGVKTSFGRAVRLPSAGLKNHPMTDSLTEDEKERYQSPQLLVIPPGGPYFKWPWEKVIKVSVAVQTSSMAFDPDSPKANQAGTVVEAVTKDQLNTNLVGQIRYKVSERNLYAYIFGLKNPLAHIMGYFISVLRDRIANFEAPHTKEHVETQDIERVDISINDIRKNLRVLNDHMIDACKSSEARYGIILEASLITGIDPPPEVESALAAINTAFNTISSEVSLAQAKADQTLMQSRRAVEIELLKAQADVEPLKALAQELKTVEDLGNNALQLYLKTSFLPLYLKAKNVVARGTL